PRRERVRGRARRGPPRSRAVSPRSGGPAVRPALRIALLALAGALAWATIATAPADRKEAHGTFASRLLGPFAPIAAALEWGRFDAAVRAGDDVRAWRHADRALLLAPEDPDGWTFLAHHAVYE